MPVVLLMYILLLTLKQKRAFLQVSHNHQQVVLELNLTQHLDGKQTPRPLLSVRQNKSKSSFWIIIQAENWKVPQNVMLKQRFQLSENVPSPPAQRAFEDWQPESCSHRSLVCCQRQLDLLYFELSPECQAAELQLQSLKMSA